MKTIVVTGGNIKEDYIEQYFKQNTAKFIIAVDKGLEILDKIAITPTHIIGDFDSINPEILTKYVNIPIYKLNPEKDFTDTHMALELAIELKSTEIYILGAIGSRIDHTIGNIHVMKKALDNNIICKMLDENNEIEIINKSITLMKDKNFKYISLLPLTESVTNITLIGFKYPLKKYLLKIGESIGISNEQIDEMAYIEFDEGLLIVIKSKD